MRQAAHGETTPHTTARAWTVQVTVKPTRIACASPACPQPTRPGAAEASIRASVLAHLAGHARTETMEDHLRTCRCRANGCAWHRRHRGCTGPIRLVLFRRQAGHQWTLADVCAACAHTIPHAAPVLAEPPATGSRPLPRPVDTQPAPLPREGSSEPEGQERAALLAALRYLDAALEPPTEPAARILALLCLLRADATGTARLPPGLLRALRLAHRADPLLDALAGQGWLHIKAEPAGCGVALRIADLLAGADLPGTTRSTRRRLLDRTVRQLTHPQLHSTDDATRLAALYPATGPDQPDSGTPGKITAVQRTCLPERTT